MDAPSKSHGRKDETIGGIKETVAGAVGNKSAEENGTAQKNTGKAEKTAADISGYLQGAFNEVSGAVKGACNSLTGNTGDETADKAQEKKGEVQKEIHS